MMGNIEFVRHINNKKPILVNKNEKEVFKKPVYVTLQKIMLLLNVL